MLKCLLVCGLLVVSLASLAQITFYGQPEPVKALNSASGENYIFLNSDNSEIYFSRANHPENAGKGKDSGDIWYSKLDSGWTAPVPLGHNDRDFSAPAGVIGGGNYLLYHKVWFSKGLYYGGVFAKGLKDGLEDVALDIPYFKNRSPLQTGTLSADGRYLLLSLENNLGYGVDDLFVCRLQADGSWSAAKNLGSAVNTALQELTPFLAEDNRTLFFASNGLGGAGSFDIFQSTRLDDTWQNWSAPVNLGATVNTSGSETSFAFRSSAEHAYFVSTQNSDGYGDIKRIRIKSEIVPQEEGLIAVMQIGEDEPKAAAVMVLKDKRTGESIAGVGLLFAMGDTTAYPSNEAGEITLNASDGPLEFEFKSEGYLSVKKSFTGEILEEGGAIEVLLEPLETGNIITLEHVLFYRGTANFVEGSEEELDLVVEMLNENPDIAIFLKGHTDNVGNAQLNVHLSSERVLAVEEYLKSRGIAADRISGEGYGGAQPIASNDLEETRKLNRRVEFEVIRD